MKIKELLETSQKTAYRTIYNSFKMNKTSHAYLIEGAVGAPVLETALFIAKSFFCDNDVLACEECNTCNRVENNLYPDLLVVKPDNGKDITVDSIEKIQLDFSLTPLEGKKKVYIIHQVEKANNKSINKLLKFLEEPSDDIVAILTTTNTKSVLPTIVSRCQLIRLANPSKELLIEELKKDFDLSDAYILASFCTSKKEAEEITQTTNYYSIKDMSYDMIRYLLEDKKHAVFEVMNNVERYLKDNNEYLLFLELISLYLKELIINKDGDLTYRLVNKENIDLEYALEQTLFAQHQISSNSNNGLILDQLFKKIVEKEGE